MTCRIAAVLLLLGAAAVRADEDSIQQALYGYWDLEPFSYGSNPVILNDMSGGRHVAQYQRFSLDGSKPLFEPGIIRQSVRFGGEENPCVVSMMYPRDNHKTMTLSLWAWMDEETRDATLASNCTHGRFGYGHFQVSVRDKNLIAIFGVIDWTAPASALGACEIMTTGVPLPLHEWHHIVLVIDEPNARLYLDAVEIGHITIQHPRILDVQMLMAIGARRTCSSKPYMEEHANLKDLASICAWKGRIDEVALWSRSLKPVEVRSLYLAARAGVPVSEAKLVPPWTQSLVFRFGIALAVLAAIGWLFHRIWTGRLRRQLRAVETEMTLDRERQRISQDIHDDLGARLAKLSMHSALALADHSRAQQHMETVNKTAEDAARSLDELVWALKPNHDSVSDLAGYLADHASEFLADSDIALRLDIPVTIPHVPLRSNVRHDLLLASKEALTNIVKHARATEVGVVLRLEERQVILRISDNGIGILAAASDAGKHRNGMRTMSRRLGRVGGKCDVNARTEGGTLVEFIVPLEPPHAGA